MTDTAAPPPWTPPEPQRLDLVAQIAEVKRELALRANVYPGFVARHRMSAAEADKHFAALQAALQTLLWFSRNEARVRAALAEPTALELGSAVRSQESQQELHDRVIREQAQSQAEEMAR